MAVMLAQSLAPAQDARDDKIRQFQAIVNLQAGQIKNLTAKVAELKAKLAAGKTGPATRPADGPGRPKGKRKPLPAEIALKQTTDKIEFTKAPLGDVVDFLRVAFNVTIVVDWKRLAEVGVRKTSPISIHLVSIPRRRVTLRKALWIVLGNLHEPDKPGYSKLDFDVRGGRLLISSRQDVYEHTETKTYSIRSMLTKRPPRASLMYPNRPPPPWYLEQSEQIASTIRETVDRNSWKSRGGKIGSIRIVAGALIVTQNRQNHACIAELIPKMKRIHAEWAEMFERFKPLPTPRK